MHSNTSLPVCLAYTPEMDAHLVHHIYLRAVQFPGPIIFYEGHSVNIPQDNGFFRWSDFFFHCPAIRKQMGLFEKRDLLIVLTSVPNEHNWLTSPDPNGLPNAFVYIPPNDDEQQRLLFGLHQVAKVILQYLFLQRGATFDTLPIHSPAEGCIFDFIPKLQNAIDHVPTQTLCPNCHQQTRAYDIDFYALQLNKIWRYVHSVRREELLIKRYQYELPYPISVRLNKWRNSTSYQREMLYLIDLFDSMVRTWTLIALSVFFDDEQRKWILQHYFNNNKPTLGRWAKLFTELLHLPALEEGNPIAQILSQRISKARHTLFKRDAPSDKKWNAYLWDFVRFRNHFIHNYQHAPFYGKDEYMPEIEIPNGLPFYRSYLRKHYPIFSTLYGFVEYTLDQLYLMWIDTIGFSEHGDVQIDTLVLHGDNPYYTRKRMKYSPHKISGLLPTVSKSIYLYCAEGDHYWHSVSEFFRLQYCSVCFHPRLLLWASPHEFIDADGQLDRHSIIVDN